MFIGNNLLLAIYTCHKLLASLNLTWIYITCLTLSSGYKLLQLYI